MKKIIFTLSLIIISLNSIFAQDTAFKPEFTGIIPIEKGKFLMRQCSRSTPKRIKKYFIPTKGEIQSLEANFKKMLSIRATNCCYPDYINNLDKYGFQYLGVVIKKRKFIYINAFHKHIMDEWNEDLKEQLTHPIVYCDGGVSFWGVLFDLETHMFYELSINGR